jgi:hypothetical protein
MRCSLWGAKRLFFTTSDEQTGEVMARPIRARFVHPKFRRSRFGAPRVNEAARMDSGMEQSRNIHKSAIRSGLIPVLIAKSPFGP